MAGIFSRFYHFILFFYVCFSEGSPERRFSDYKRCADDECSMLLVRGKAAKDFSGPDCRFLSFKKGETIYVYYKLSGQRSDVWAGSVGSSFGYFPKDFLNINHIYTDKEVEVSAEETDFVCFDTGVDKFESYDIDFLLSNSLLLNESDGQSEKSEGSDYKEDVESNANNLETLEELPKDASDGDIKDSDIQPEENKAEEVDSTEDIHNLEPTEPIQQPLEIEDSDGSDNPYVVEDDSEIDQEHTDDADLQTETKDFEDELSSDNAGAVEKIEHVTEVDAIPKLKTTLGTTFDAVTSDDEDTKRVTPYFDEEESKTLADHEDKQIEEGQDKPALLPTAEKNTHIEDDTLYPSELEDEDHPTEPVVEKQDDATGANKDGNMWSSLGDKVFNIVSGGERTVTHEDTEDEEEEDDDDEDTDQDISEKDSDDQIPLQISEINEDEIEIKHSNEDSAAKDSFPSRDTETVETKQSDVDPISEDPILSKDTKEGNTKQSDIESMSEDPVLSKDTKEGNTKQSDIESMSEDPVLSKDTKEGNTKQSDIDSMSEDPVLSKDTEEINTKSSNAHFISEDIILPNDTTDTVMSEQDSKIFEQEDELEELESGEESEASKESLDVDETLTDIIVESEQATTTSDSDKPVEEVVEKTIQKATTTESIQSKEMESPPKEGAENASQFNAKTDIETDNVENDVVHDMVQQQKPAAEEETEIVQEKDEQIDRVKKDIVELFESTLKAEQQETEEPAIYEENEDSEELLEDENAILSTETELTNKIEDVEVATENNEPPKEPKHHITTQTNENTKSNMVPSLESSDSSSDKESDQESIDDDIPVEIQEKPDTSKENEYSENVLRLMILRDHLKDDEMERIQKYLDLKDLFRIEAMFSDLEQELKSVKESKSETSENIERKLESILEVSENFILDEIEKILDAREQKAQDLGKPLDPVMFDEEAAILDDFQELAFALRKKYSAVSDSVPLVEDSQSHFEMEKMNVSEVVEDSVNSIPVAEVAEAPEALQEVDQLSDVNAEESESHNQDMGIEEDSGHFNKNKDIQTGFKDTEEVQRGPQAILETPVDIALGFEMDPSSGSLEPPSASEFYDKTNYEQASTSVSDDLWSRLILDSEFLLKYAETMIATLPEEWQPGPTFHGLPWKPVVTTAIIGILTVLIFTWRTILAVKGRTYLLTEKQLGEKIQQLVSEKSAALLKITELNNMIKQHEEKLKTSEKSRCSTEQEFKGIKTRYQDLQNQREELRSSITQLREKIAKTQEENKTLNDKMVTMHQKIEKHQNSLKSHEEERLKVQVLMDEAKLREDALKAQLLSFEKDNGALKEQKKTLLRDAKDWQEKHEKLSEEIKVYYKTQKDLEDSLVHKENEIDVLTSCIAELKGLEVCEGTDAHTGDTKLSNGDAAVTEKKGDPIKLRLKQMMDVSRIKAKLSVIEDERNRYLENLLREQKSRQELEEQFQKVVHDQTNLKNEKTHLESQYNNLQQRLEITTELYQQKENALQQKLTQEELERREKETKLSEVDGRALQAEEELGSLRQKVKDMQEEMQQNERALKAEIAVQEKKAHENWLKARASERALIEEKRESANLRQKIVECSDRMSDLEHTLYKSAPPDRHVPAPRRGGDSYGPSPVSGGAPSPPLMIEGPGRPPSAPVGRRNEPFGPRPPSDAHGRFSDLGHPLPNRPELYAPRTSSPCTQDGSTAPVDAKAEASSQVATDTTEAFQLSKSQNQGSFLPSPIRDSPVTNSNAPPKAYGPPPMGGQFPHPSDGPLPSMSRPPNGHPPMIPPGLPLGPDPRFRPPHMDSYGPTPLRPYGPVVPPFARGMPMRDLPPMGPPPPPFGPHNFPPDFPGPRDLPFRPRPFPPGPLPPSGPMAPPPFGARDFRGHTPTVAQTSRDCEMTQATGHATDGPPQQENAPDTAISSMAEP
ncbi:transport and Golgi organization protein 1 homolog [Hoplias malabaricus]|uniref:transport and Golgi organization protein 1 homolog n=1 Tax=Hoplias malabaricus TaxID=27720 RepID=UPI0034629FD7